MTPPGLIDCICEMNHWRGDKQQNDLITNYGSLTIIRAESLRGKRNLSDRGFAQTCYGRMKVLQVEQTIRLFTKQTF